MQGTEIELGGFRGRTNKLVDGCYSWWCGGSFALLGALGVGGIQNADPEEVPIDSSDESWADVDGMYVLFFGDNVTYSIKSTASSYFSPLDGLYDQKALQGYVLHAGQHPIGGLRDKPPKYAVYPSSSINHTDTYPLIGTQIHITPFIVFLVFLQLNIIYIRLPLGEHSCKTHGKLNLVS
jgi:hypothetical protein